MNRPVGDVFHPDTREVLLTKEQSSKLDWKPVTNRRFNINRNQHYAYRLEYEDVKPDEEEHFVKSVNAMASMFGMAIISSLEDTDFACTPVDQSIFVDSKAVAYAILTEEQVKEIFG